MCSIEFLPAESQIDSLLQIYATCNNSYAPIIVNHVSGHRDWVLCGLSLTISMWTLAKRTSDNLILRTQRQRTSRAHTVRRPSTGEALEHHNNESCHCCGVLDPSDNFVVVKTCDQAQHAPWKITSFLMKRMECPV